MNGTTVIIVGKLESKMKKNKEGVIGRIRKRIPLETRLKVMFEMSIQTFLTDEIGHIPDGYWTDEKEEKYGKQFRAFAKKLTERTLRDIKEWEDDGRPPNTYKK